MVFFPFQFVKEKIEEDDYRKPILVNRFGTFESTPFRREKILNIVKEKENGKQSDSSK